jgi:hypothetical protein
MGNVRLRQPPEPGLTGYGEHLGLYQRRRAIQMTQTAGAGIPERTTSNQRLAVVMAMAMFVLAEVTDALRHST